MVVGEDNDMEEKVELRIYKKYAHLLVGADEGKDLGLYVAVEIPTHGPKFERAKFLTEEIKRKYDDDFFLYSEIKRKYSKKELDGAPLLHLKIRAVFEPTGEECGTVYDETVACEICGANRKQVGSLILHEGTIPRKDIAKTIGGEVVVSEKFANAARQRNLTGLQFSRTNAKNYYQLTATTELELSSNTIVGVNPFDLSTSNEGEIYKCPKGHTLGLNLLSEPYIVRNLKGDEYDFFASRKKIGVKRGLLRPQPIYICSQAFRQMVLDEKLSGFDFEIANTGK